MERRVYEVKEKGVHPCGCIFITTPVGFDHYINPDCSFDKGKKDTVKGYRYFAWRDLATLKKGAKS